MKKTFVIALLGAFVSVASAEDITLNTVQAFSDNYNSTIHGFALSLTSTALGSPTLEGDVILDGFTLKNAGNNTGTGVTYGFVVLDNFGNNTVLGVSTGVGTTSRGGTNTFTFTAVDGTSPLTLNASSTYRYIAVGQDVLDLIASDTTKTYVFNGGGSGAVASTTADDTVTVTQGLRAPGIRGHYGTDVPTDSAIISAADLGSVWASEENHLSPILTNVQVSTPAVPELATATLSLLALAGLAARRRRK